MEQERVDSATAAAPVAERRGGGAAAVEYSRARLEDSLRNHRDMRYESR